MVNFKPTLWKTIISLIPLILLPIFFGLVGCKSTGALSCSLNQFLFIHFKINPLLHFFNLGVGIVIYVIWSLVQKRK